MHDGGLGVLGRLETGRLDLGLLVSFQSSFVVTPLKPFSSSVGSTSAPGTPKPVSAGPIARTITCLGAAPVTMNPPMSTLSSVSTCMRVEMLSSLVVKAAENFRGVAIRIGRGRGERARTPVTGKMTLKTASPLPSVVTSSNPRKVWPSP